MMPNSSSVSISSEVRSSSHLPLTARTDSGSSYKLPTSISLGAKPIQSLGHLPKSPASSVIPTHTSPPCSTISSQPTSLPSNRSHSLLLNHPSTIDPVCSQFGISHHISTYDFDWMIGKRKRRREEEKGGGEGDRYQEAELLEREVEIS